MNTPEIIAVCPGLANVGLLERRSIWSHPFGMAKAGGLARAAEHWTGQCRLLEPGLPWIDDGSRFFSDAEDRHRFARITEQVLIDADVPFVRISGSGTARYDAALRAMGALDV